MLTFVTFYKNAIIDTPGEPAARTKPCPHCGATIRAIAQKCGRCGKFCDPEKNRAARQSNTAERLIVPVGLPVSAIAAGYLGQFALFPMCGALCAIGAIIYGRMALTSIREEPELTGKGRAIFGICTGVFSILFHAVAVVMLVLDGA